MIRLTSIGLNTTRHLTARDNKDQNYYEKEAETQRINALWLHYMEEEASKAANKVFEPLATKCPRLTALAMKVFH